MAFNLDFHAKFGSEMARISVTAAVPFFLPLRHRDVRNLFHLAAVPSTVKYSLKHWFQKLRVGQAHKTGGFFLLTFLLARDNKKLLSQSVCRTGTADCSVSMK